MNLVPNPSYEVFTNCPNNGSQIYYCPPWYTPTWGSPDYFNACAPPYNMSVPSNFCGNQIAKTGVAYAGMFFYGNSGAWAPDDKEYLQVELTDSLVQDRIYCVSFYVNYAISQYQSYNNVAITEIGIYISNDSISTTNQLTLPYFPQIVSPPNVYINDTLNWTLISGNYVAHGGERYITIGNFNNNADTMQVIHHNNYSAAYYYIDDVSVVDCTTVGVQESGERSEEVEVFPNPTNGIFTINTRGAKIKEIKVMNVLGSEILSFDKLRTTGNGEKSVTIDVSGVAKGIYFVRIEDENKNVVNRKIVAE